MFELGGPGTDVIDVLSGALPFPLLVLKESALRHNLATMSGYCETNQVALAPQVKTTMSLELARRQLHAGAWGLTVATPGQARVMRELGCSRVIVANQVIDPAGLRWIAAELDRDPSLTIHVLADSVEGTRLMADELARTGFAGRLPVLVEVGCDGGRTGCRSVAEALHVAAEVARTPCLRLAGIEAYEGVIETPQATATLTAVDEFLRRVRRVTEAVDEAGLFTGAEPAVVSAGASAYFDRAVSILGSGWTLRRPVHLVLRCGSYLIHDHGLYERLAPFGSRLSEYEPLRPAMELWSLVQSVPEPGRAVLGFGKRDASYDVDLPMPVTVRRRTGRDEPADGVEIRALNDHHAYADVTGSTHLEPGDLVCSGLSHPCTALDKWRVIPVVDDDYRLTDVVHTDF